jgi:hypothetical protein
MASQTVSAADRPKTTSMWKIGPNSVPGRPAKQNKLGIGNSTSSGSNKPKSKTSGSESFEDFTERVSDAWDIGDDEFCSLSATTGDMRICRKEVETAAISVLETHKQQSLKSNIKNNWTFCTDQGEHFPPSVSTFEISKHVTID